MTDYDDLERAVCSECGTELEAVRPGKHQHPGDTERLCHVIRELRAERDALEKALRGCRDDLAWMHDYDGQMNQKCCLERIAVIDAVLAVQEKP